MENLPYHSSRITHNSTWEKPFKLRLARCVTRKYGLQVRSSQVSAGNLAKDVAEVRRQGEIAAFIKLSAL
jgi:hypothetical protein